jgi:hypothetical protein
VNNSIVCVAVSEHVVKLLRLLYATVSFFSLIMFFVLIEGIVNFQWLCFL